MNDNKLLSEKKLQPVLSLKDLIIYGLILIQPVAALPLYGHATSLSHGHAVTCILIAMIGMIFTAFSYGKMANRYVAAGSAYTYVSKGLHPYPGFIAGWCMFMDYMFLPIICIIYCGITAHHLVPIIPYILWLFLFASLFTSLNLKGLKIAAIANWILMIIMSLVVFYFMAAAIEYIVARKGLNNLFSLHPFYAPGNFSWKSIASATSLAALTYIGFDGITTLSEEVKNPKRNVLLAAVLTCVITGIWSGAQVYLAQLTWPNWISFTNGLKTDAAKNAALDTAIMSVAHRVGGSVLDVCLTFVLLLASVGSGITGQIGASRLLYGMGRDNIIPKKFFGYLDKKYSNPSYNIILIGVLAVISSLLFNYEECARLINFGAFFAFMAVNLAMMREYYFRKNEKTFKDLLVNFLPAMLGFAVCLFIWLNLPLKTFIIGGAWMLIGIIYLAVRTKGFQKQTPVISFS